MRWPRCRRARCAAGAARWPSTTSSPATTCWRWTRPSASPAASRSRPTSSPATSAKAGRRALLNYGHTLAHALEIATDYSLAHGEAVAIGLVYAAHLAHRLGRIDERRVDQHYDVVGGSYELDTALPAGRRPAAVDRS